MPARPLRSVLIGDTDHYPSEYIFGVAQGMALLGHWHTAVSVRNDIDVIERRVEQTAPDVIWGHMLLWPPGGPDVAAALLDLCRRWRQRGTRVIMHDGDARESTRYPTDISDSVDVVLCNHMADRSAWNIRQVRWPYFAFVQPRPSVSAGMFLCSLAFAGRLSTAGIYAERTAFVFELKKRLGSRMLVFPNPDCRHTLMRTPELAASADAVLGYGRPESPGWLDVRVFQYPGAGGVLLYDDVERAGEFLTPWRHFVPYQRHDVDSVMLAVQFAKEHGAAIRHEAFQFVQERHTSVQRVEQALAEVLS